MDLSVFSTSYTEARDKFLSAAQAAGAAVGHWPHPLAGPAGEALACDTAWLGAPDAPNVLVVVSATHGVEGFAGSGPQVALLRRPPRLADGTAVLLVHAVNPHGFAWQRRVTEENVDLNRNWVDYTQPLPANPGYAELHAAYGPRALDAATLAACEATIAAWRDRHGAAAERFARSSGQYTHPDGIFYGGDGPTWARRTSEAILARHLPHARTVAIVDLHTGLGPYGYGEPICNHAPGGDRVRRARRWWGDSVTEPLLGTSSSQAKYGLSEFGYERALAHADIAFVALEFGTYQPPRGETVLRDDHWLWQHGDPRSASAAPIRDALRDHFFPPHDDWKEMVLFRSDQVFRQALHGLATAPGGPG
ncbi:M14 family metallopeptidase [Rubrivivax sp. RP6-9]|uniref:M14 family metallopeptidase n=1 Tax=Rubrivivax sp. RP6-9 TaxID=3415750 RepID=UPI003CC66ADA